MDKSYRRVKMIYLYSGTPGSGKSLDIAHRIYWALRTGNKYVICNFNVNLDSIKHCHKDNFVYIDNSKMNPDVLMKISKEYFKNHKFKEGKIFLIIDECQLLFNAREWNTKGRAEWLSFYTQHRKLGFDVFLVAQFDQMIDKQIRSLIEYQYIHRKVSNFGFGGKLINAFAGGKLFVSVKVWYPLGEKIGSEFFKASKKYYSIYDTYNTFD